MMIKTASSSRFSITIKGIDAAFRITQLDGSCAISHLYQYDILCATKNSHFVLPDLLNKTVVVTVHDFNNMACPRFLHGIINTARYSQPGQEYTEYRISVVPTLWYCTQKTNQRIFQEQCSNDIIAHVLKEHGIEENSFQDNTKKSPIRQYCVQFGESDYDFVARILEQEGWHFHYRSDAENPILVLAETNTAFKPKSGSQTLRFEQETSRAQDEECIHQLTSQHQITAGAVRLSDFNSEKPNLNLNEISAPGVRSSLEHYHHPGGFSDPNRGNTLARRYLQQSQHQAQIIYMETHSIHCAAGQWFQLEKHPNPNLNQRYLIINSQIFATQPQSLEAGASDQPARCITYLQCIPMNTVFRSPWEFKKPVLKGPHSAIVTGPKGEEIYTDRHGRIKVQFYWDREGKGDEKTSCWIRVNQPVAGLQWGGIALPRVGQEVIVDFEHGDPERPVIIGRLYNGQNTPPSPLPNNKSQSSLKSLSSPGGGGYHEIRLEDKKGSEQIFVRAEKDMDLRVQGTLKTHTERDQGLTVTGHMSQQYNADLHTHIQSDLNEHINHNLSMTLGADLQLKINGAHIVEAGDAIHIKAGRKAIIQGGGSLSVKGGAGIITLDASGVAIAGPVVRINEGGPKANSAESANPTLPGSPAEADNANPGTPIRAATGPQTPIAAAINFDRTQAQLAALQQAHQLQSPFVEECSECSLTTEPQATRASADHADSHDAGQPENWVELHYKHADGSGVTGAKYTLYDIEMGDMLHHGKLDENGYAKVPLTLDKARVRVDYHDDSLSSPIAIAENPVTPNNALNTPPSNANGWLGRMLQHEEDSDDSGHSR
jgi:type VI secretion system secreted protein VgrG